MLPADACDASGRPVRVHTIVVSHQHRADVSNEKMAEDIKAVTRVFEKTAGHEDFRFFGGVELGEQVTREQLLERYHAVVEQMLSIRTVSSVPIAIASTAGRVLLAMVLSAAAGVGYGFLRQQVGPDLVKALSLDPRGQIGRVVKPCHLPWVSSMVWIVSDRTMQAPASSENCGLWVNPSAS